MSQVSTLTLVSGLASLATICLIYFIMVRSSHNGWWRNEAVQMFLVPILIGFLVLACAEGVTSARLLLAQDLTLDSLATAAADLIGLAAIVLTLVVFRALAVATRREKAPHATVTPMPPRPAKPNGKPADLKKAA